MPIFVWFVYSGFFCCFSFQKIDLDCLNIFYVPIPSIAKATSLQPLEGRRKRVFSWFTLKSVVECIGGHLVMEMESCASCWVFCLGELWFSGYLTSWCSGDGKWVSASILESVYDFDITRDVLLDFVLADPICFIKSLMFLCYLSCPFKKSLFWYKVSLCIPYWSGQDLGVEERCTTALFVHFCSALSCAHCLWCL